MADEDKKPEKQAVIVHKKKSEEKKPDAAASAPKKKVVVVKRSQDTKPAAKTTIKVVASQPRPGSAASRVESKAPAPSQTEKKGTASAPDTAVPKADSSLPESKPRSRPSGPIGITSARPNVKAGNLSDKPRYGNRYNGGGYGNRPRKDAGGGFTGTQAREGYQSRQGGYGGRQGGQGAYGNRSGFGGRTAGQGGYSSRPGFGGQRTGFAPRPGFGGGAPSPMPDAQKGPAKKAFKGKKQVYSRKDKEEVFDEDKFYGQKKKQDTALNAVPDRIDIMETISVSDLARKMNLKASEIIGKLMGMGMMVTINQSIDSDTATIVASEYNCEVHLVSLYDETVIASDEIVAEEQQFRPPIVTVMGHVDHGKTKTLDAIRNTNVVAGEFGGITQHIGAYQVHTPKGDITFLDTPGHEAFTMMRARGAQITDIVVLVVAADDGVMPQTREAINHAKDAEVPIIVAVNKIDKPEANPDRVRTQLSELGLTPEDWGGETQYVNISALKRDGIDDLLEAILLQAEILELKAPFDGRAEGKILESRVDQGRGVVSTVVVQRGTLRTGDPFVAGIYSGRVRAMFDDHGKRVQEATPSMPVEVLGMEAMPNAGDPFQVTDSEKTARSISAKRQELRRFEDAKAVKKVTLDNFTQVIDASEVMELKVLIKADVQGSAEALKQSLEKLSTKDIRLVVIHSSAGAINESDVMLAAADSNAIIIGFNVRPTPKAKILAEQEKVDIRKYNVIYKAVEEVTLAMEGMLRPDTKESSVGTLEVRDTFRVPKVGVIAGCYVSDGMIKRSCNVNVIRDGIVIFTGKISSLKHYKDDVKELSAGYECGVGVQDWQDIRVGDQLEVFEYVEVARKLGDTLVDDKAKAEAEQAVRNEKARADAEAAAAEEASRLAAEKERRAAAKRKSDGPLTPEEIARQAIERDEKLSGE